MDLIAYTAYTYGFIPIPLRGKYPKVRKWQNLRNREDDPEVVVSGRYPSKVRLIQHLIERGVDIDGIGVLTGEPSGIIVLDIDAKDNGIEKWNNLVSVNNGIIPRTFLVKTGSGGYHYYFKYRQYLQNIPNMIKILGIPLDYKTNGGMAVFPGSISSSGNIYTVVDGYDNNIPQIAELPSWLLSLLITNMLYLKGVVQPTQNQFNQMKLELGIL